MNTNYMGSCCKYSKECHVFKGLVQLKQPLFLIKNIYCNNGPRWWSKCNVYDKLSNEQEIDESVIPVEDLRL